MGRRGLASPQGREGRGRGVGEMKARAREILGVGLGVMRRNNREGYGLQG